MKGYLLDTHILLWWLDGDQRLPLATRQLIANPQHIVQVSAVSAWEIAIKFHLGKLPGAERIYREFRSIIQQQDFEEMPILSHHALKAGSLPMHHKDPFDRMLIAQSQYENIQLLTDDALFVHYGIELITSSK